MNLKKWLYLFFTTMLVGGVSSFFTGLFLADESLYRQGIGNFLVGTIGNIGAGVTFSVLSQMGFFAYLTVHRFGLGLFKGPALWNAVQVLLILFTFYDLGDLRYRRFAEAGESYIAYFWLPACLLLLALPVAWLKAKATSRSAFVPALFFMFTVTAVEWIPALEENKWKGMLFMFVPLFLCNAWQLMQLHRLTGNEQGEGARQKKRLDGASPR
ncbi:KinB signaling pathway activation protein KbaA [Bacillaceae bacterium]